MNDFKHSDREHLSPNRAAERLVDLAYALTVGSPMEIHVAGERVTVAVGREVVLESASESKGREVKLELALSWSTPETSQEIPDDDGPRRP